MKREIYSPFLRSLKDNNKCPNGIFAEETLAQCFSIFLLDKYRQKQLQKCLIRLVGDNEGVQIHYTKGYSIYEGLNKLLEFSNHLEQNSNCLLAHTWTNSNLMKLVGVDLLSRHKFTYFKGIPVLQITRSIFREFTRAFNSFDPLENT